MAERIRDVTVAEAIAAEAGTDATPELVLSEIVNPVLPLQPRPPLASSGYIPGTIAVTSAAALLNTSHCGIFGSGAGRAIIRVNWLMIFNFGGASANFSIRRVDSPFTGWPSVRAVPGYINAGAQATGGVFSVTKNDTVAPQGLELGEFPVADLTPLLVPGPWILNDGILVVARSTVNTACQAAFGYEMWPAIRPQRPG